MTNPNNALEKISQLLNNIVEESKLSLEDRLSVCLSVCLSVFLCVYLTVCLWLAAWLAGLLSL